jgi:predicted membrane protein
MERDWIEAILRHGEAARRVTDKIRHIETWHVRVVVWGISLVYIGGVREAKRERFEILWHVLVELF